MPQMIARIPVTIDNGASLSDAATLFGGLLSIIEMPAAWTAANLTFQTSGDAGVTFMNVYDDVGNEVAVTAAASRRIRLSPADWVAIHQLKVRSGTAGVPVNQGAERILYLEVWE